jgi:hypothetical protein
MRRRRRMAAGLAFTLLTLQVLVAPAGATARSEHDRIVAYWTEGRMKSAIPRDLARDASGRIQPRARPGTGGGVTGASWRNGGPVLDKTGKVYFVMGGSAYVCSGSVINDQGRNGSSMVLTAGHCAIDETNATFATNWLFIPNFDGSPTFTCADTVYGCWTAQALVVHYGYAHAGSFDTQATTHDWAFAVVGPGGKSSSQLDTTVGDYPIRFSGTTAGDRLAAFGYPAAGKYKGKDLTYCAGNIFTDAWNEDLTWGMGCTMTGGSSGGPWFFGLNESDGTGGTVSSLTSYGYSGVKNLYGPMFNAQTQATYNAARTTTSNTIVGTAAP